MPNTEVLKSKNSTPSNSTTNGQTKHSKLTIKKTVIHSCDNISMVNFSLELSRNRPLSTYFPFKMTKKNIDLCVFLSFNLFMISINRLAYVLKVIF